MAESSISRFAALSQDFDDFLGELAASGDTVLAFPSKPEPAFPAVFEPSAGGDRLWLDCPRARALRTRIAAEFADRITDRQRHCYVYENADGSYHLLLVAETNAGILADRVDELEAAVWLCSLVNRALGELGALL
jgi:hypothetical protein